MLAVGWCMHSGSRTHHQGCTAHSPLCSCPQAGCCKSVRHIDTGLLGSLVVCCSVLTVVLRCFIDSHHNSIHACSLQVTVALLLARGVKHVSNGTCGTWTAWLHCSNAPISQTCVACKFQVLQRICPCMADLSFTQ